MDKTADEMMDELRSENARLTAELGKARARIRELSLERDSWERLERDVAKPGCCAYFQGCNDAETCDGCPALKAEGDCGQARAADVVRRAKALAGVL